MEHNLEISAIYSNVENLVRKLNQRQVFRTLHENTVLYFKIGKVDQLPGYIAWQGYAHLFPVCPHHEELFPLYHVVI